MTSPLNWASIANLTSGTPACPPLGTVQCLVKIPFKISFFFFFLMLWKVLGVRTHPRGRTSPAQGGRSEQVLSPTWEDFGIWAEDAAAGLSDPEAAPGSNPS